MAIAAGKLRHRVTIKTSASARDSHGGIVLTYSSARSRWAAIEPVGGTESREADAPQPEVTHRIRMRHGSSITPKDRIEFDDRTFEVVNVLNVDERSIETICECQERI